MRRRRSFVTVVLGRNSLRKDGLIQFLRSADFGMVTSATSANDLCASRFQQRRALYLIIHTGDDFEFAVEQIEPLKSCHPDGRVVVVADRYRLNELAAAFRAGANGYFVDVTSRDVFIKSIELVMLGETVFPPAFLPFALDSTGKNNDPASTHDGQNSVTVTPDERIAQQLSQREESILHCLVDGDSNKLIARKIDIAEATVKVHVKAILRKIGVQNRTQAAIWGINHGWLKRSELTNFPRLAPNLTKRTPHLVEAMPGMKRTDARRLPNLIEDGAGHTEAPRLNELMNGSVQLQNTPALAKASAVRPEHGVTGRPIVCRRGMSRA